MNRCRLPARLASLLLLAASAGPVAAQSLFNIDETGDAVGSGYVSFGLFASSGDGTFTTDGEPFPAGDVDTRAALFGAGYRFAPRWTAEASVPYVRRRHIGRLTHNPALLIPQRPGLETVDDGDWHGGVQDFSATLRYDASDGPLQVRPFLMVGIPLRNYTFFGNSAIGTRLHRGRLGIELSRPIGLSDFYWRAQYAYEVIERSYESVNTNAHLAELELGWYATPRLMLRGVVSERYGQGLPADADFGNRTNERWYYHDRNAEHSATVAGLGAEYHFEGPWSLSLLTLQLVDGRAIHRIRHATTLELSWHF